MRVEHDGRAAVGLHLTVRVREADAIPQGFLRRGLDPGVERRDQRIARLGQTAAGHGVVRLGPAEVVDLELGHAVAAAQPAIVAPLQAALADHVSGRVAGEALLLELVRIDLAHIAQEVSGEGTVGIRAQVVLLDLHAGERRRVLEQIRHDRAAHVFFDHDKVQRDRVAADDLGPGDGHEFAVLVVLDRPAGA